MIKLVLKDTEDHCLDVETVNNDMGCEQGPQGIRDFLEIPMIGYDIPTTLYPPLANDIQENVGIREFRGDEQIELEIEATCHHHNRPRYHRHLHGQRYPHRTSAVIHHPVQVQPEHRRFACWTIGSCVIGTAFIILLIVIFPLIALLC